MIKLLFIITLFFPASVYAANINDFSWIAKSEIIILSGNNKDYLVKKAFRQVQKIIDDKAKSKEIPDGTSFEVIVIWKGKEFKRTLKAHREYPIRL
jgi:hypothetical protein